MDDFKTMARLLAAIRASESSPVFDPALVSARALKASEAQRDSIALKLQGEGYIEGLFVIDDMDNAPLTIIWNASRPTITIKGLEFIHENKPLRKAGEEIRRSAEGVAAQVVAAQVERMF